MAYGITVDTINAAASLLKQQIFASGSVDTVYSPADFNWNDKGTSAYLTSTNGYAHSLTRESDTSFRLKGSYGSHTINVFGTHNAATYGVFVKDEFGNTLVTLEGKPAKEYASGSINIPSTGAGYLQLTLPNRNDYVLFLRSTGSVVVHYAGFTSATGSGFSLEAATANGAANTLNYVFYQIGSSVTRTSDHGFSVFDSSGNLIYNDSAKQLLILQNHTVSGPTTVAVANPTTQLPYFSIVDPHNAGIRSYQLGESGGTGYVIGLKTVSNTSVNVFEYNDTRLSDSWELPNGRKTFTFSTVYRAP